MPVVYILILFTHLITGEIDGHAEALTQTVEDCHAKADAFLVEHSPEHGMEAHVYCLNMLPLPASQDIRPEPSVTL